MLIPQAVTKESGFVGHDCAFCKEPFAPGEQLVVCPIDSSLHHTYCWQENGDHCTSLGCHGHGTLTGEVEPLPFDETQSDEGLFDPEPESAPEQASTESTSAEVPPSPQPPPTTPPIHFRFAQSCLMLAIAIAIIIMAFSCFGLWAILDYIMLDVVDAPYR